MATIILIIHSPSTSLCLLTGEHKRVLVFCDQRDYSLKSNSDKTASDPTNAKDVYGNDVNRNIGDF